MNGGYQIKVPGKGAKLVTPHSLKHLKTVYFYYAGTVTYG